MSINGGRRSLQLGLNVLLDSSCEGCAYHEYPYEFQNILISSTDPIIYINSDDDLWDYIWKIKEESESISNTGSFLDVLNNIYEQLPFFGCNNRILNSDCQKDIAKYVYCKDTNTPPYPGSYQNTPSIWIDKYYSIKNAMILRDKKLKESLNG
tara:strand:+ start:150 stop:608 length:459 start_codon:yes stop_codon:yes gene_type:complete